MEEHILEELCKAKDPMSSTELAHALDLNKRTVLRYLNALVDAGQVLRVGQGRRPRRIRLRNSRGLRTQ